MITKYDRSVTAEFISVNTMLEPKLTNSCGYQKQE